jgi:hypothetical protein
VWPILPILIVNNVITVVVFSTRSRMGNLFIPTSKK